jgi:drug/metabolite transporter (DMT)-like permease
MIIRASQSRGNLALFFLLRKIALPVGVMRLLAFGSFFLVNVLYASFSIVARETLVRVDPIVFTCFQMLLLVPFALFLLYWKRKQINLAVVIQGALLGGFLGASFLCIALALKMCGITQTTVFICLNGVMATLIAVFVLRQRVVPASWGACLCALIGALILWRVTAQDWQGNITAFVGGSFATVYAFLVESLLHGQQRERTLPIWPVFGVQFLTMATLTVLTALCFGNWQSLRVMVPSDLVILVYTSVGTILVPVLLENIMQRYVSAMTVSYLAVLEPLVSATFAFFIAGERLAPLAYTGAGMILIGVILQATANAGTSAAFLKDGNKRDDADGLPAIFPPKISLPDRKCLRGSGSIKGSGLLTP